MRDFEKVVRGTLLEMGTLLTYSQLAALEQSMRKVIAEIEDPTHYEVSADGDLTEQLLQSYVITKQLAGRKKTSIKQTVYAVKKLCTVLSKPCLDVTKNDIKCYMYKVRRDYSINTAVNTLAFIRSFYTFLSEEDILSANPCSGVKVAYSKDKEVEYLSESDILKLYDHAVEPVDKALLSFCLSTGVRCGELVQIKIDQLDFATKSLSIMSEKSNKMRRIYLNARACKDIEEYLSSRDDTCPYLFVNRRKRRMDNGSLIAVPMTSDVAESIVKRLGQLAGLHTKTTVHVFRRTLASKLVNSGVPIEVVSKLLGHRSINTTLAFYAKIEDKEIQHYFNNAMGVF